MRHSRPPLQIDGVLWHVTRVTVNSTPGTPLEPFDAIEFRAEDTVRRVRLPWTRMPSVEAFHAMTAEELRALLRRTRD